MNILFLTYNQTPTDGWSVVGSNICNNIQEVNIEIYSREENKRILFGHKRLKTESFVKYWRFSVLYDILNILLTIKNKPGIIHCNVEHYAPVAMWLSKIYKIPYTITAHGTYGVVLPLKYDIYRKAFKNASKVITVSNFTKRRMIEKGIKANYVVILNGVDKEKFKPNNNVKKENIITFVGNLKPRKGLSFLLDSMIEVNKIKPEIKVVIIGSINHKSEQYLKVLEFINKNNINVEFVGKITEEKLIQYYQKAKLNVLPSQTEPFYFEGFGLIHVEANACGTLTIGTKNSGNEDAITDGNGYLVEYDNTEELKNTILEVFNMEVYPTIGYNELDDWKDIASKYNILFRNIIDKYNKKSLQE